MISEDQFEQEETIMNTNSVNTTLGELIYAISEAAQEALVEEQDLAEFTQHVIVDMLCRD